MTEPIIHILLATHQGNAYLWSQLNSLANQTYPHWHLWASDDGSTDGTQGTLKKFALSVPKSISLIKGPCKGVVYNFYQLMVASFRKNSKDLYAFCDQDDIWLPDKLANAVTHYKNQKLSLNQPYLYCSSTIVVDEELRRKKTTAKPNQPLSFGNALLQNVASGNTMVFNAELLRLMLCIKPENVIMHDWLAYQVATGCNGLVYYDPKSNVLYRQHDKNLIGANSGVRATLSRLRLMKQGQYKLWANQTEAAMENISDYLSPEATEQLKIFTQLRQKTTAFARVLGGMRSGLRRQTKLGQISLLVGLYFNLI